MKNKDLPEVTQYRQFTAPAELNKAINELKGIVAGINCDNKINEDEIHELSHWCLCHANLQNKHPFNELIPMIEEAYSDGILEASEAADILWLCNNFSSDSSFYDSVTSNIQFLTGLIHGIMADGIINDDEIYQLKNWIKHHDFLAGTYPFDEIDSLLISILDDGIITDDERNVLTAFLSNFIDVKESYNLSSYDLDELKNKYSVDGICAICQEIDFDGTTFCFTGQSKRAKRKEIAEIIESLGGKFNNNVTKKTRYLIVGNDGNPCWAFSCYGRKIEEAVNRRKNGQPLTIVNGIDFWDIIDDLV